MFYLIPGIILSLGFLLIVSGLRGRRIDDHPWCRKCRFDLFGRDNQADPVCPECGCNLDKPNTVRVGQRKKRRGMILIASFLLFFGTAWLGVVGYSDAMGVNWQHHKPVWLLMREANDPASGSNSNAAVFELRRRYDAGLLTAQQVDDIIEAALTHQADAQRPWLPIWGNFVEQARTNGATSDEQWARYAQGIIVAPHRLVVRPEVVLGSESLAVQLEDRDVRMGDGQKEFWLEFLGKQITIGPLLKSRVTTSGGGLLTWNPRGSRTNHLNMSEEDWQTIGVGEHTIVYEYEVGLFEKGANYNQTSMALATSEIKLERTIQVLPPEETTIKLIKEPAYRQGIEDRVGISSIRSYPPSKTTGKHTLELRFNFDRLVFPIPGSTSTTTVNGVTESSTKMQTIDLACDIIVRHHGTDYNVGSMSFAGDSNSRGLGMFAKIEADLRGQTVDLILRPSISKAEDSLDCHEIWGEEIVFKDIKIN